MIAGRFLPHQPGGSVRPERVCESLKALDFRKRSGWTDADLQSVAKWGRIVCHGGKFYCADRMKSKDHVGPGRFRLSVSDAPAAGVPIAEFHPSDLRAARLPIFWQMLF